MPNHCLDSWAFTTFVNSSSLYKCVFTTVVCCATFLQCRLACIEPNIINTTNRFLAPPCITMQFLRMVVLHRR